MVKFNQDFTDMFLGVVRKYMQLRGGLSQKDLAVGISVGVSTMSRFLNQKTKDIDAQMIASLVAFLNIPLHEVIDYIEEDSTETFKKMIIFYKESIESKENSESGSENDIESFEQSLDETNSRYKTSATIKGVKVPFGERRAQTSTNLSIRDKLNQLSPRQKGFLTDFLDLDVESRDLIVDIGNQLFRYFKQGQADF
ncbi:MAG: helix-turn-helix transcriptional regulator [Halobacteriovoraceae bacterium]|nr:helix-turn-helix transcriptional regulator [Halobacteriovoraceae bacterium]